MENKTIKEIYDAIEAWLKDQDSEKIKFLQEQRDYNEKYELSRLKKTLKYHYVLNECSDKLEYIYGEKIVTLKEIAECVLKRLDDYGPEGDETEEDFNEDQLSSGYADMRMVKDIQLFWNTLDDDKLISIANGSTADDYEVDLDGYRCGFLSRSGVYPLVFNYIYYNLKKTLQELDEDLYNSNDSMDEIESFYPPKDLFLPSNDIIEKLYGEQFDVFAKTNLLDFNSMIKNIVTNKRFTEDSFLKKKIEQLEQIIK